MYLKCILKMLIPPMNVRKVKLFSTTFLLTNEAFYKLVIVGGGTGGITMASRMCSKIEKEDIAVIEPSDVHYYQPYWTLVGGGIKDFKKSSRLTASVLPKGITWLKDEVVSFNPSHNVVETKNGLKVKYNFLIVAMGLNLAFEKIKGLPDAFETPGVCSNYSPLTVNKTVAAISNFNKGNAIFTQPANPIKCAGAPQKIMYLAEDNFRKSGRRERANILFFTALNTIFSAPKYAHALTAVAKSKGISINYLHSLVEVNPYKKEAIFVKADDGSTVNIKYELLHVTPPMVSPTAIRNSSLCDSSGFMDVDKYTLQHKKFENIFGIGDCTNIPTSKTAAAVAAQCGILTNNIFAAMEGKTLSSKYNGYTSCPLVTGNRKGILAEFDFDLQPLETLPIDQGKERYISYILKKDVMPFLYWNMMLKGYWKGPETLRKILHFGF